jgi:mxaJ protein
MRVCAEPNNLPYSNRSEQGFENRIAELIAQELQAELTYAWIPQPRTAIRDAMIQEGECDLLMGVPDGLEGFVTTLPYYRSTYVFVYRDDSPFEVRSFYDQVLQELTIGVQAPGGQAVAPAALALIRRGLVESQLAFVPEQSEPHPQAVVIQAVADGEVDVAVAWGPVAGYFAGRQAVDLELVPVEPEIDAPFLPMVYSISIGLRRGDEDLRDTFHQALAGRWSEIQGVLEAYRVPLLPLPRPSPTGALE